MRRNRVSVPKAKGGASHGPLENLPMVNGNGLQGGHSRFC
jgi:hypothetical protein